MNDEIEVGTEDVANAVDGLLPSEESSVAYVYVFEGKSGGEWFYEPRGGNHQTLSTSEGYTRVEDAAQAAADAYPGVEIKVKHDPTTTEDSAADEAPVEEE